MNKLERLIEDVLSYEEAMKAPRRPLSAKAKSSAIRAGLAETFGKSQVLSEDAMRLAILKILNEEGTATGAEMVERLKKLRWEMEPKGEGAILGLLYQMSNRGLIFATFDEDTATRRYQIEDVGSALLQKDEGHRARELGTLLERQRLTTMAEETIPRPIRYRFLSVAQKVCDLAKVDYWEYPEVLSGLREQMEASYRAYDQAGDYKDDSEAKALEDFGSVHDVARLHRGGWRGLWCRLLFSERYTVHRLVGPVIFGMMHSFLRIEGSLKVSYSRSQIRLVRLAILLWCHHHRCHCTVTIRKGNCCLSPNNLAN